nr:MAG TPA: hypothetical protein [Caudoviricetes sp.]
MIFSFFIEGATITAAPSWLNTLFLLNLIALTSKVSRYILIITHIFEHIEEISLHIVCNCA